MESLSEDVPRLKDKSFIVLNEQSRIIDIAEKQLKSGIISLGLYGFADVGDFLDAYAALGSRRMASRRYSSPTAFRT